MKPKTRQKLWKAVMWTGFALFLGTALWSMSQSRDLPPFWLPAGLGWVGLFQLLGISAASRARSRAWQIRYGVLLLAFAGIIAALRVWRPTSAPLLLTLTLIAATVFLIVTELRDQNGR